MSALANIPTGLQGFEQGIAQGLGGLDVLNNRRQQSQVQMQNNVGAGMARDEELVTRGLRKFGERTDQAVSSLSPYATQGQGASGVMAALSGAMGADAQAQAFADFQASPGQSYLIDQGEKAILRNSAATGGTRGNNVLQELQQHGIGLAAQDLNDQFARLGNVADRGYSASSSIAGLRSTQGAGALDALSGLGGRSLDARTGLGMSMGSMGYDAARTMQGAFENAGNSVAGARYDTGNRIADSINSTRQMMAGTQGGEALAEILGGNTEMLGNLIIQAQNGDAQAMEGLAALLANISVGAGSATGGTSSVPGIQETQGVVPRLLDSLSAYQ
jgi:hypothetical protein